MIRSLRGRLGLALASIVTLALVGVALLLARTPPLATIGALLAIAIVALLLIVAADRHARRVAALEASAGRLAGDERGAPAEEVPADELGALGRAINRMAGEGRARLEALRRERDEHEHILTHMSDGVVLLDGEGCVLRCNHSLAALLDAPRPAGPGTRFTSYVRVPELHELVLEARVEQRPLERDVRLWAPRSRLLHATAIPVPGADSWDVLLLLRDLTEVERLDRVRQDFVANVSHELRTPLTSIRGYAETLLEGGLDDAENRAAFVRTIRDNAVRLEALAADLLTLADLERPGTVVRAEAFDLRELAESQVAGFRAAARAAGLALEVESGSPVPVEADRPRLEQVLANLLDNAIKYTEQGRVLVRLGEQGAQAWCEIEDSGPGVPREDQPRIFERFYRVDKARSRGKGGTGLGLSIVKNIVALHQGEVAVRNAPDHGAVFRFEIPLRAANSSPARLA